MSSQQDDEERVRALREVLTATGAGVYLATHMAGPLPVETQAAVHESDELELRVGRVGPDRDDDLEQRDREARAVAAAALRAAPERLVLAHGTPDAAYVVALELLAGWERGDDAGPATRVVLLPGTRDAVAGAVVRAAAIMGVEAERLDEVPRIIAADTALVVLSHLDRDGRIADVAAVAQAAGKAGARVLVDAGLSVGALPIDIGGLGAHAVIADAHRWLLGPEAVTLVWLSPALGDDGPGRVRALVGPFGRGALLGLARSIGWLLMYVELPWLLDRTARLASQLHAALDGIDGVDILAPADARSPLVAFRVAGWDAVQAEEELSRSVFAILEADREHDVLRASVGGWNREDELERFTERVAELAAHTPETLPRRPSLTVLSGPGEGGTHR